MEVGLHVECLRFLVLIQSTFFVLFSMMVTMVNTQTKSIMQYFPIPNESIHINNSTQGLLQKGNFAVVAALAASIKA